MRDYKMRDYSRNRRNTNSLIRYGLIGLATLLVILAGVFFIYQSNQKIKFIKDNTFEINTEFDYKHYIKEVKGNIDDVVFDKKKLNTEKVGEYGVTYSLDKSTYNYTIRVIDKNKPIVEVQDAELEINGKLDPKAFIKSIDDESDTKVEFDKDYKFDDLGKYKVKIKVTDASGNQTIKEATVKILPKDTEKPELGDLNDLTIKLNANVNLLSGVSAKDNSDPNPKITVDKSNLKINKEGKYVVTYTATDRAGNKTSKKRNIIVSKDAKIGTQEQSNEKIVYLTFDDGPSDNTLKVLDILKKYNVKATFFVTGLNPKYNYVIKEAHDQGHTIGLHTFCHDYKVVYSSMDAYLKDLKDIEDLVKSQIGYVPKYIRLPGGSSNTVSRKYSPGIMTKITKELLNRGYQYYDWNISSGDADGNRVPTEKLIAQSTNSNQNNINILMHDTHVKVTTVEALPKIIEHYKNRGYSFKGIDDSSFAPHHQVNN